jgi:glycosyltransferase involved in cell wall biosynthesis
MCIPGWAVKGTDCVLAMSPHGMLEPWALEWSRAKKRAFGAAFQSRVLDRVDIFHATSQQEADSIRAAGFSAPIAVVPIGIDMPDVVQHAKDPTESKVALYLGRIHPVKNLPALIEAWDAVARDHPNWTLIIGGPGDAAYLAEIDQLISQTDRARFQGPAFGDKKSELLSAADLFILPSHSENFGVVVAEALAHGVPVVATTGTPWQGLETHGCGWWIDPSSEGIASALDEAMREKDEALTTMGKAGRTWMQTDFTWDAVARNTIDAYRWVRSGGEAPRFVASR